MWLGAGIFYIVRYKKSKNGRGNRKKFNAIF